MHKRNDSRYRFALSGMKITMSTLVYILIAVFLIFLGRSAYSFGYRLFNEQAVESAPGTEKTVTIPEKADVDQIASILKKNGLISDKQMFKIQERLSDYHGKMQGGTYRLNTSYTPTELITILAGHGSEVQGYEDSPASDDSSASAAESSSENGGTSNAG